MSDETTGLERVHRHLSAIGAESLTLFKTPYFERRLRSRLRATGTADAAAYADVLDREPAERKRLVSALAIAVTGFFRNPTAWIRLGELIAEVPARRPIRAWSAGCATGEEAWSLALLLAARRGAAGGGWAVEATDLDERSLEVARAGEYSERSIAEIRQVLDPVPGDAGDGRYRIPDGVRAGVRFRVGDLTRNPLVTSLDLILCRNVLIYFAPAAQEQVMRLLLAALAPGGLLMLGKAELAAFDLLPRLEIVDRRERIYRRVG